MSKRITTVAALCLSASLIMIGCEKASTENTDTTTSESQTTSDTTSQSSGTTEATSVPVTRIAAENAPAGTKSSGVNLDDAAPPTDPRAGIVAKTGDNALNNPNDARYEPRPGQQDESLLGELTVRAEPEALDLGDIPTGDAKTGIIKLVNFGSEPARLVDCKSSCGCTAAKCPRNKVIEPGQSVDVEIKMSGAQKPQKVTKVMRFMIEGQPQLPLSVSSETVSFVLAEPWIVDRDKDKAEEVDTGTVMLTSKDEQAFRVLRMHPPIIEDFSDEPAAEHDVKIDWTRWEELGSTRRLTFYTDHPKCDKLYVTVQALYKPVNRSNTPITKNDAAAQRTAANRSNTGSLTPTGDGVITPGADFLPPAQNPVALIKNGQTDALLELIEANDVDLEHQDRTGATLLALAAHNGKLDIVRELIALGADVESRDRIGKTPLMWAGHAKDVEVIRELLDAGADIRARDTVVGTALSWTSGFGDAASVRELIESGSDVNVSGTMGFTPIIWAALTGEADSVKALLEAGADAEVKDMTPAGSTPLMHAAQTGNAANVKALLDHGVKINATDREGKTALLVASEKSGGDIETIETLIEAGADVTATDLRGRTALDLALTRTDPRSEKVIEYLQSIIGSEDKSDDE